MLGGITIGENAIVGAGSVVTKGRAGERHGRRQSGPNHSLGQRKQNENTVPRSQIPSRSASQEFETAIREVIDTGAFAGGPFVEAFEKDFAAFCDCEHAIGLGNGTDALWLALLAAGIGPGDEVITVPNTFMATAEAISYCGAKPVFVDVDERTYTMDPTKLEAARTSRTKAVILFISLGNPPTSTRLQRSRGNMGSSLSRTPPRPHGAEYKGRKAGSIGDVGCFSFYPGKNLGAFGEAAPR